ncbi:helix-turn-helix transcriptional regulator [Sphaerisporangium sp. TRM90804]|nr:helix-turn-helix transcriptional regulator [Sphaerisporangium sp. TRM90804]MDH2424657.1 helix-turn-helix transcriptional regulator [Sphaerisporangium sp. TRM90804]
MTSQDLIGQRIKTIRRQRGLSQAQLAHPELSDSYVSLIESGKRTPTTAVLELLAAKLDCSITYLINGVTAEQMHELELGLGYASLALHNGEAAEARRRYADLLSDGGLVSLPSLSHKARYGYALAAEACGDLDEAIEVLSRLRDSAAEAAGEERAVAVVLALCRCYRERGKLTEAVQVAEEVLFGTGRPSWNSDLMELGSTLLTAYVARGDLLRAQQFALELLGAAEMLGTPRATVAACWNAALVADEVGQAEEAIALAERAFAIQSETGDARNLARVRNATGVLLMRARPDEAAKAKDLLVRAKRDLTESAASVVDVARCLAGLANAEIMLGEAQEAVGHATKAVDMLDDGKGFLLTETRLILSRALILLGKRDEAIEQITQAEKLLQNGHQTRKTAASWLAAAEMLEVLDDEASVDAYHRALACAGL